MCITLSPQERTALRRMAGLGPRDRTPVVQVHDPRQPEPAVAGESWHYETRTGLRIWHPSAYKKIGWSSARYVRSTRRVEVDIAWLAAWCTQRRRGPA